MIAALALMAGTAVQPPAATVPDVQLDVTATARRVVVDRRGRLDLTARSSVNGEAGTGDLVRVDAPDLPEGRRELRNVRVQVRAETRIAEPLRALLGAPLPQEPQTRR